MKVTLLGTGGSSGVPLVGGPDGYGDWGACDPGDPRNRRLRTSALVQDAGRTLLIDAGPDLRQQCLANGVTDLDAVAFTHVHADHVLGIDDLRMFNRRRGDAIDTYGDEPTLSQLQRRFDYAFKPPAPPGFPRPALTPHLIAPGDALDIAGFPVRVLRQDHKVMETLAFRIGAFAYSTDLVTMPEETLAALEGLDTWVVGCFQVKWHPVHANLDQVLAWVARLRPRRTVLTHMGNAMDYAATAAALPPGVEPGFDGMMLDIA